MDPAHRPTHRSAIADAPVAPGGDTVLSVRGLRCSYGDFEAVRGIDLTVRRGELFALLGTNGAGKTTALETIEGHRRASGGAIEILGMDPVRDRRNIATRVGVVLQDGGLPDDLTAAETVALWRDLRAGTERSGAPVDVLARVGLRHRADVRTRQLSGGERRRLDLALSIATSAELLILDEPTSGMDPEARASTWTLLRELLDEGRTILLTTHYLEEAEALADRLAIMHEGRIAAHGTVADLVADQDATIRFRHTAATDPARLPDLTGRVTVVARRGGDEVVVATRDLQGDLAALLRWTEPAGTRLPGLRAVEANLSELFLGIAQAPPEVDR